MESIVVFTHIARAAIVASVQMVSTTLNLRRGIVGSRFLYIYINAIRDGCNMIPINLITDLSSYLDNYGNF